MWFNKGYLNNGSELHLNNTLGITRRDLHHFLISVFGVKNGLCLDTTCSVTKPHLQFVILWCDTRATFLPRPWSLSILSSFYNFCGECWIFFLLLFLKTSSKKPFRIYMYIYMPQQDSLQIPIILIYYCDLKTRCEDLGLFQTFATRGPHSAFSFTESCFLWYAPCEALIWSVEPPESRLVSFIGLLIFLFDVQAWNCFPSDHMSSKCPCHLDYLPLLNCYFLCAFGYRLPYISFWPCWDFTTPILCAFYIVTLSPFIPVLTE